MEYNSYDLLKIGGLRPGLLEKALNLKGKQIKDLITHKNIMLFDPNVNENNLLDFIVYIVHVTKDLIMKNVSEFLKCLAQFPFKNFKVEVYKNKTSGALQSVVIMSKYRRSRSNRRVYMTLYDKYAETLDERYRNVLRIERKICTFKEMCKEFNIVKNDLHSVLYSKINPIKTSLQEIYDSIDSVCKKPLSCTSFDLRLYENYFEKYEFNFPEIENQMKLCGATPYKIKKAKKMFLKMQETRSPVDYKTLFKPLLDWNQ